MKQIKFEVDDYFKLIPFKEVEKTLNYLIKENIYLPENVDKKTFLNEVFYHTTYAQILVEVKNKNFENILLKNIKELHRLKIALIDGKNHYNKLLFFYHADKRFHYPSVLELLLSHFNFNLSQKGEIHD